MRVDQVMIRVLIVPYTCKSVKLLLKHTACFGLAVIQGNCFCQKIAKKKNHKKKRANFLLLYNYAGF